MKEKLRVLLAHSDAAAIKNIQEKLEGWDFDVEVAKTVDEVFELARYRSMGKVPNVVLACLDGAKRNNPAYVKEMRKITPAPIIFMSKESKPEAVAAVMDAGAHDFLKLPFGTAEHLARIEAAVRNTALRPYDGAVFETDGLKIVFDTREVYVRGQLVKMTPIEFRLLTLLAINAGKVCTHEELITDIWGTYNTENLVLRVNMANIRKKIEETPGQPKIILTETGIGYRIMPATKSSFVAKSSS